MEVRVERFCLDPELLFICYLFQHMRMFCVSRHEIIQQSASMLEQLHHQRPEEINVCAVESLLVTDAQIAVWSCVYLRVSRFEVSRSLLNSSFSTVCC